MKYDKEQFLQLSYEQRLQFLDNLNEDKLTQQKEVYTSQDISIKLHNIAEYFRTVELPEEPFKIGLHSTITNLSKYIQANLTSAKRYKSNTIAQSYFNRLLELKNEIEQSAQLP